jgi:hypothetical protein
MSNEDLDRKERHYAGDAYRLAYALHKECTNGPCGECGGKDGDGVSTCFYSDVLGAITHQNTDAAIRSLMNESQRSLYDSYNSMQYVYLDEASEILAHRDAWRRVRSESGETEDHYIARMLSAPRLGGGPQAAFHYVPDFSAHTCHEVDWQSARHHREDCYPARRRMSEGQWFNDKQLSLPELQVAYMAFVYEPHACGKGHGRHAGAYRISCTGCREVIELWEFGMDYDVG